MFNQGVCHVACKGKQSKFNLNLSYNLTKFITIANFCELFQFSWKYLNSRIRLWEYSA